MERTMKRWLALLLAVVMTVSLFPTSALAARWDEERPETPAVDGTQVVDAQKKDDGEQPEVPVGPDDPVTPARDLWTISLDELTTDGEYTITVYANGQTPNDTSGDAVLAIVPNVRGAAGLGVPQNLIGSYINGTHQSASVVTQQLEYAALPAGVSFVTDVNFTMENGMYVLTGILDDFDFDAIADALDGKVYLANGDTWTKGGRLEFVAILVTAGAPPGVTSDVKDVGGGLADAVWVVNITINGNQAVSGPDAIVDNNGSYNKTQETAQIPLYNSSGDPLYIFRNPTGEEEFAQVTATSGNGTYNVVSGSRIPIGPDECATLPIKFNDPVDGDKFEITVPNYVETDDGYELKGTAKITVYVLEGGVVADPLTFYVTVESDGTTASIKAGTAGSQAIRIPGAASWITLSGDAGDPASNMGEDYGLTFDWGDVVDIPDTYGLYGDPDEETGEYPPIEVYVVSGSTEDAYGGTANATSRVKLDLTKVAGRSWATGSYPGDIQIEDVVTTLDEESENFMGAPKILIPVTIIVEVAKAEMFIVTFDPNGGTWGDGDTTKPVPVESGNYVTPPSDPTRAGWHLKTPKWKEADGTPFDPANSPVLRNITVYAQWDRDQSSVKFEFDGGHLSTNASDTGPKTQSGNTGESVGATNVPTVERAGYRFDGWLKTGDSSVTAPANIKYPSGEGTTDTYTAQWTENTVKITVQLNGSNSTTPAGSGGVVLVGGGTTLLPKASSSGGVYDFGELVKGTTYEVKINNVTVSTFTATEGANTPQKYEYFTYEFVENKPSGVTASVSGMPNPSASPATGVLKGTEVSYAAPTLDGYTFNGWKINDGTTNWTGTPAKQAINTETTFTAQWGRNTTTVTFHWNDGADKTQPASGESGDNVPTDKIPTPSRTGYSWDNKWYTDTTYTTEATLTFPNTGNTDVYAQLKPNEHTITYAPGTAVGATIAAVNQTQTVHYDDTNVTVKASTIITGTDAHWNFVEWQDQDGNKYAGTGAATITRITKDLTLTAQWTMDIWFNLNLPSGETTTSAVPATVTIAKGGRLAMGDLKTLAATANYNFAGWATTSTAASSNVTAGTTGTVFNAPTELFAVWTPKDYTITFNKNTSATDTTVVSTLTKAYGSQLGTLPTTSRTDYTFDGWFTARSGGTKIDGTTTVDGDKTYYAHWTQKTDTVTVNTVKDAAQVHNLSADTVVYLTPKGATDTSGAVASGTITAGTNSVTIDDVPMDSTNAYDVWLGTTKTVHTVLVDDDNATESVNIQFYTLTLTKANSNGYVDFATSAPTADGATLYKIELPDTVVNIAAKPKTNYTFGGWTGGTAGNFGTGAASTAVQTYKITTTTTLEAQFTKSAFDAELDLRLNNKEVSGFDSDIISITVSKKSGSGTFTTQTLTAADNYDTTDKVWKVAGLPAGADKVYTWTVQTRSGNYTVDTTSTGAVDPDQKELFLYSVDVQKLAYGNTGSDPTVYTNTQTAATATQRAIGKAGQTFTLAYNQDTGYTPASPYWTETVTGQGTVAQNSYKLNNPPTGLTGGVGQVLKPVYTYEVTVKTVKSDGTTAQTVSSIVLKDTTATGAETDKPSTANVSSYKFTGLTVDRTYDIYINGFKVGDTSINNVSHANAGGTVTVKMFSVSVQKLNKKDNSAVSEGTVGVSLGTAATATAPVYLPIGATTTAGASDQTKVNLAAGAGTNFRLYSLDDTATTGMDEVLWKVETFTAPTGKTMTATINNTTSNPQTPNNLMVGGADGMQADVTVTAYFVRQYGLTVSAVQDKTGDPAAANSKVKTTEKQGLGTSTLNTTEAQSVTVSKVDADTYVEVKFVKGDGESLKGWKFDDADGALYTGLKADGTVDTGTKLTGGTTGTAVSSKATTVYFVPASNGATLKAVVEQAKYKIHVTVNENNTELASGIKVELKAGSETIPLNYDATDKWWAEVYPNTTYTIYTNVANGKGTADTETAVKTINFSVADGEGTGNINNLSEKVNYYTVKLAANPAGTAPKQNTVKFDGQTTYAEKVVLAKSNAAVTVVATAYLGTATGDTVHYRFDDWTDTLSGTWATTATIGKETYTLPTEADLTANTGIAGNGGITLTAEFVQQFRVTVDLAPGTVKTTLGSSTNPKVAATTAPSSWDTYASSNTSVLVDEDGVVQVGYSGGLANWYFKEWSRAADTGTFNGTTATTGNQKGTKKSGGGANEYSTVYNAPNSFSPTADSTLYADFWQDGKLDGANWTYTQGNASASDNSASNQNQLGWTANDAQTPTITVTERGGTWSDTLDATKYSANTTGGKTTYTLTNAYLDSLTPDKIYDVTFTYTLGTAGTTGANTYDLTQSTLFSVERKKFTLVSVDIQVKDTSKKTLNIDSTDNHGTAEYKSHNPDPDINPLDKLTLTWYYSETAPTSRTVPGTIPSSWKPLTGTTEDFTGTGTTYTAIPNFPGKGYTTADIRGLYVFAVAEATGTGTGRVVTNVIPVDYDATVTVRVDGSAIAKARENDFRVYLRPVDPDTGTASTATTKQSSDIQAEWNDAAAAYKTKNSALTGGMTYQVWVNEVSGVTADGKIYLRNTGKTVSGSPQASQSTIVDFYSVNWVGFCKDEAPDKDGNRVGETFSNGDGEVASVNTANNCEVANGAAVLTNTSVTAKSNPWDQDYTLTWRYTTGNNKGSITDNNGTEMTDATDTTYKNQTSTTASTSTGYTITVNGAKTYIGGRLYQKRYTITGDVRNPAGSTGGSISGAELEANGHKFSGSFSGGGPGTIVTFNNIPKTVVDTAAGAIGASYKISATEGTSTTIMGYAAPAPTPAPGAPTGVQTFTVAAGNTATTQPGKFTIFVAGTIRSLTVTDGHNKAPDDKPVSPSGPGVSATSIHTDTGIWRNYGDLGWGETVKITNSGNTPLDVTLTITKTKGSTTTVYSGTADASGEVNDGVVKITGLDQLGAGTGKITLAKDAYLEFPFTVVKDTLNWDEGDTYTFTFSSVDARDGTTAGPKAIYQYVMVINPVHITSVTTTESGGTYTATDFEIEEDNGKDDLTVATKANNGAAPSTTGDLVYTWYVAPWNAKVEMRDGEPYYTNDAVNGANRNKKLDLGKGTFADNGTKYTPHNDERGMALYLVLEGRNNATDYAVTPDITKSEPVVLVPYQGKIIIREEDVQVTDDTEGPKYTVKLHRTGTPATDFIETTWDTTSHAFVTDFGDEAGQLWARDPNDNTSGAWEYEVWASRVKGDGTLQNTGLTIKVDQKTATVDFYKVSISDTGLNQGIYEGETKFSPTGGGLFLTTPPTSRPTAAASGIAIDTDNNNGYVQKGNTVTFTYPDWTKDYTLTWGNATGGPHQPGAARTATRTYSAKDNPAVTTVLSLNTYDVQANVTGMGAVEQITMTLEDDGHSYVFDIQGGGTNILGLTSATTSIAAGDSRVFRLPKGTYSTLATLPDGSAAKLLGYKIPAGGSQVGSPDHPETPVDVTVTGPYSYDVLLQGDGLLLAVTDDVPGGLGGKEATNPTKGAASGQATISGDETQSMTVTQEINLNYNYGGPVTITLTATNGSKQSDEAEQILYNVTFTPGTGTGGIAATTNGLPAPGTTMGKPTGTAADDEKKVVLTIPNGLNVGKYTYSGVFSYNDKTTGGQMASVTYTLTVNVNKLPFTGVTTSTTGKTHSIADYSVTTPTFGEVKTNDSESGLTTGATKDYLYQWVRADIGVTPVVSWADGALTVTDGSGNDLKISGATGSSYTEAADGADDGKALYLVIYATHKTTQGNTATANATGAVISSAITTGYQGKIFINLDGTNIPASITTDPGYEVQFIPSDGSTAPTVAWTDGAYTATLDPNVPHYTVKVGTFRGASAVVDLQNDDGSLVTIDNDHREDAAKYFTVTPKNFHQVDYAGATGAGETIPAAEKQISMTVGGEALPTGAGTPVLKDQSVLAVTTTCTKDYTRTWQSDKDTSKVSVELGTDKTSNVSTYTQTITDTTFIGGRLKQNTYAFVGNIKGPKGNKTATVKSVSLTFQPDTASGDTRTAFTLTATAATNTGDHVFKDGMTDGNVNGVGDTVTFTVVKGAYKIVAKEGPNTVITKVTLGVDDVVKPDEDTNTSNDWATRNEKTMTQAQAVTGNGRIFNIYVEDRALQLTVADVHSDPHSATSFIAATTSDNNSTTHTQVYYFHSVDDTAKTLTLTNESNAQMTVTSAVTKIKKANFTSVTATPGTAWAAADKVDLSNWVFSDVTMDKDGTGATKSATFNVNSAAANADDYIYIVKITSKTTDTDNTTIPGPTVYYVFDLTIDPLPIMKVEAMQDGTTEQMRLKGSDTATGGLDYVWVDDDGKSTTVNVKANTVGIKDSDVSYVWYYSDSATLTKDDFEFKADGSTVQPKVAGSASLKGTGKNCDPDKAEQGKFFYLIAFRNPSGSNADDFAVSEAVYAQVTISLKAYQTGKSSATDDPLTAVQIWETEDTSVTSNDGTIFVTGSGTIDFTADMNAYLHGKTPGTTDDPSKAVYYFHHWAVKPLSLSGSENDEIDESDASVTTPVGEDRLKMNYAVTEQATVIGYYDLLPVLSAPLGYDKTTGKDVAANRTFTYFPNDGSGKLAKIVITGNIDGTTVTHELNSLAFEGDGFSYPAAGFGAQGAYVIPEAWIKQTAVLAEGSYTVTFYDEDEGSLNGGYEGYDRSAKWNITEGEKRVTAQVKDSRAEGAATAEYWGEVTISNGTDTQGPGTNGLTVETAGNQVSLTATPNAGYKFKEWKTKAGNGDFSDDTATPVFTAKSGEVTVEASFEPAEFSANTDATAAVYYGDDEWDGDADEITISGDPNAPDAVQSFKLELPDYTDSDEAAALKKFLTDSGKTETEADAIVAKAAKAPSWLVLTEKKDENNKVTGATFSVGSNATDVNVVKDATDEVVAYVKITEQNATNSGSPNIQYVPYTVDVKTAKLKIVTAGTEASEETLAGKTQPVFDGDAYRALYKAATDATYPGEGKDIENGEKVLFEYFNYINVQNTRNATDFADGSGAGNGHAAYAAGASRTDADTYGHVTNGYWTVAPANFDGVTGGNEYVEGAGNTNDNEYVFTYHYTGEAEDKSDALNYEETASITLKIPVLVPSLSLKFRDEMKPTAENKPFDVRPATVDRDTEKGWGPYSPYNTAEANLTESGAPLALNLANDAWRNGEHITYLDNEPYYKVTLQKIGTMYNATLTEDTANTKGFAVDGELPDISNATGDISFLVKLTALDGDKLWAGEHTISFTAKGNPRADGTGTDVVATYTLTVHIDPKVITELDVKLDEPVSGGTPDTTPTVQGKTDDDPDEVKNLLGEDGKGNTPVKPEVTWYKPDGTTPMEPNEKFGEDNYPVKVVVTVDPNYIYAADDPNTDDVDEDIQKNSTLNDSEDGEDGTEVTRNDEHTVVTITKPMKSPITIGATFGGFKREDAGKPVEDYKPESKNDERYPIANEATYGEDWFWATSEDPDTPLPGDTALEGGKTYVLTVKLDPNEDYAFVPFVEGNDDLATFNTVKLTDVASLAGLAEGVLDVDEDGNYTLRYHFTVPNPSSPPPPPSCPYQVFYYLGLNGTTDDSTIEAVSVGGKPANVPEVTAIEGYTFLGWSLTRPEEGKEVQLIDPTTERITEDTTFYAVYEQNGPVVKRHTNYIVGFPNGTFGPEKDITRAQVATIIARAILPGFKERSDYGNIGNYSDVEGHWAASAIAYCSRYGVFKGYDDGTFQPNRSITRQELALVVARLDGIAEAGELPFRDSEEVSSWALDGIFTAYDRGLIKGYEDGTFRPQSNIRRDEAVTIFNRYLKRGVDAKGLEGLTPYLYGETVGEAGSQYMVWPDVPETLWSYYEVIEASNDHEFYYVDQKSEVPPEHWTSCWIDGTWDDGSADKLNVTATSLAITAKTSVPFVGTEATAAYVTAPTAWVGMIRTPLWVSKELEVQF